MMRNKGVQIKKFAFYSSAIFVVLVSCAKTTIYTSNGDAALSCSTNGTCVAVGSYFHEGNPAQLPLAVFSDNSGATFSVGSQPVLPTDADPAASAQLLGVHCVDTRCAGVGYYNQLQAMSLVQGSPLAVFSEDSGKTFSSAIRPPVPSDVNPAFVTALRSITNSGQRLVAVGAYNVQVDISQNGLLVQSHPLVVVSDNKGNNFVKAYSPNLPTESTTPAIGMLYDTSCVGQHCVAIGFYRVSENLFRPLILISDDGGQSFEQFGKISYLDTVNSSKSIELRAITCTGLRCLAVGLYQYNSPLPYPAVADGGALPLVLMSNDGGLTFSMNETPELPDDADTTTLNAEIKTITCAGFRCVAGGSYNRDPNSQSSVGTALSIFSNDGGLTFMTPNVPLPMDGNSTQGSLLTGVSCIESNCVGAGTYNARQEMSSTIASPLTVFSPNNTPAFTSASQANLPIGYNSAQLNTLGDSQP